MNVFRLVLCLAGLAVFLAVRQFSPPPIPPSTTFPPLPKPVSSLKQDESLMAPEPAPAAAGPRLVGRVQLGEKTVTVREVPSGERKYDVARVDGEVIWTDLSEEQLQRQDGLLFDRLSRTAGGLNLWTAHGKPGRKVR